MNTNNEFDLNRDIEPMVLDISLSLVSSFVGTIRRDTPSVDDIRREIAANRGYSQEEQLDELSAMLAVALQVLALQTTWDPDN